MFIGNQLVAHTPWPCHGVAEDVSWQLDLNKNDECRHAQCDHTPVCVCQICCSVALTDCDASKPNCDASKPTCDAIKPYQELVS